MTRKLRGAFLGCQTRSNICGGDASERSDRVRDLPQPIRGRWYVRNLRFVALDVARSIFGRFLTGHHLDLSLCFSLAPRAGFEPATNRLTAGCSTAELPGNALATVASNKRGSRLQSVKSAPADFAGSGGRAGWRCPHAYARAELAVASATAALSEGPSSATQRARSRTCRHS